MTTEEDTSAATLKTDAVHLKAAAAYDWFEMVAMVTEEERRDCLRESFDGYDRNRDGYITSVELTDTWRKCLLTCGRETDDDRVAEDVKKFMASVDKDDDSRISFEEYVAHFDELTAQKEAKRQRLMNSRLNQPLGAVGRRRLTEGQRTAPPSANVECVSEGGSV